MLYTANVGLETKLPMSNYQRDRIWEKSFEVYYDSYFHELICTKLIDYWQRTDTITQIAVALFASGSAISGWALWQNPSYKLLWTLLAGMAAVLSIVHGTLQVSSKLKTWVDSRRSFANLRIDIETTRSQMEINPDFDVSDYEGKYVEFKKAYSELYSNLNNDIFDTKKLRTKMQSELDNRLEDIIEI